MFIKWSFIFLIMLVPSLANSEILIGKAEDKEKSEVKAQEYQSKTRNTVCSIDVTVGPGTPNSRARVPIAVEIDPNKFVFGVKGKAADRKSGYDYPFPGCSQGGECAIGWSRFSGNWKSRYEANKRIISWIFENWKHDRSRTAYICVTTN